MTCEKYFRVDLPSMSDQAVASSRPYVFHIWMHIGIAVVWRHCHCEKAAVQLTCCIYGFVYIWQCGPSIVFGWCQPFSHQGCEGVTRCKCNKLSCLMCNYLCGYNMDSWGTCLTHVTFARRILYAEHEVELMCRKGGSPRWYEQCQQPLVFMLVRRCATSFCRYFGLVRRQEESHKRIKTRVFL